MDIEELLKPTLQDLKLTSSYNIKKLFYVAFFGGLLPTIILSYQNAKMLFLKKTYTRLILLIGSLGIILKIIILGTAIDWEISKHTLTVLNEKRELRYVFRFIAVGIYYIFYLMMKKKYIQHIHTFGVVQPLIKKAIIWIFFGGIIELVIITGGVLLIGTIY